MLALAFVPTEDVMMMANKFHVYLHNLDLEFVISPLNWFEKHFLIINTDIVTKILISGADMKELLNVYQEQLIRWEAIADIQIHK